ncbi:MFS transporter [Maritimibacter sp. 55A14]|uniref:MFS transporter n=1 Tax=Maritimibacter sp. 55A14 TaxID=2174844 RepID=UPI000D620768|nr:MFS transporter [Maritimibacter sp. 55A14]PWE30447.1 MFS transporter [Maritimibacter sp. 55A14]
MFDVLRNSWALLLGMMLLMLGNGLQGTLLGVRGSIEGFSASQMSLVMSGYFVGFLGGSRMAPHLIRRVGHVRVFAALGSLVSALIVLYPVAPDPWIWTAMRVLIGFCFSGVYVTAESWLNNASTNENRGKALSVYLIVQMIGIIAAQGLLNLGDPSDYILFIIPSVLVSVAFAPILLSISPAPFFETSKPMSLVGLVRVSPLGAVGTFLLGGVFSAQFGMSAVYGTEAGMSVAQISLFVSMIFTGGMVCQYPIGWISDRMDRRVLICGLAGFAGVFLVIPVFFTVGFPVQLAMAFLMGGVSNPLYSLIIAYTNDYLESDDMAAASGGLIFINGVGASTGPLILGWVMGQVGPNGFYGFIALLMFALSGYAVYRMTQRPAPRAEDTTSYAPVGQTASPVAMELAQEIAIEMANDAAGSEDTVDKKAEC